MDFRTLVLGFAACFIIGTPVLSASPAMGTDDPAQGAVWDLSPLFRDDAAWGKERAEIEAAIPGLSRLKGSFGSSAPAFRAGLEEISAVKQRLERLSEYADLNADVDASSNANQARVQEMSTLQSRFEAATSFMKPEILALGRERVDAFEKAEPGLFAYRRQLKLILRRAAHTLSPESEDILAATGPLRQQPRAIHDVLVYSEIPWPSLEIGGKVTPLTPQVYRASFFNADRETRRKAFDSVMGTLGRYEGTAGAIAYAFMAGTAFEAKARHYPSSLALALSDDAMPEDNFQILVAEAGKAQPTLLRYLKLRKTVLRLDELHVYDLRVPLDSNPHRYRLDEAEALILKSLAPLGDDYVHALKNNFQSHAMHATALPGKTPGALSEFSAYRIQPFVLLTFDGSFNSVSTVAHEWGHAMHAQLFQAAQPFENAEITSVFLFDTPSLVNEMLLSDYMIANAKSRQDKILALDRAIDLLRYSYFGVVSGIGLELKAHELADRGEPVTGRALNEIYCGLRKRFDGVLEGITKFDEAACFGWINQPMYYDFYFYKYVTAVSAAGFFVDGLEKRDMDTRKHYFDLLKSGGCEDPDVLLKRAGFDAASPAAYQPMVRRLERLVAQLEAVLMQPNGNGPQTIQ